MRSSLPLDSETLKAYSAHLTLQKNRSPHTVAAYMQTLAALQTFAASRDSNNDAVTLIKDFIRDSAAQLAKSSQALRASVLRNYIHWQIQLSAEQKSSLLKHIQSPKVPKRIPRILDLADIQKITDYIDRQSLAEQMLFYLLYGSGLRISEALGVRGEDISLHDKSLRVIGKGAKERVLPIAEPLMKLFQRECPMMPKSERILGRLSAVQSRQWVRRWGAELGLEDKSGPWHPHKLRHSIASHLLQMGAKVPQIQKLLGHEQLATTEKYTHLNPADLLRIYKSSMPIK